MPPAPRRAPEPPTTSAALPIEGFTSRTSRRFDSETDLGYPANIRHARRPCVEYRSRLWTMRPVRPASAPPNKPMNASNSSRQGPNRPQARLRSADAHGLAPTIRARSAKSAAPASPSYARRRAGCCGWHRSQGVSVPMTINAPAAHRHGVLPATPRREALTGNCARHDSKRHPQGVPARTRSSFRRSRRVPASCRCDRVLRARSASVEQRIIRATTPRGRLDAAQELAFTLADGFHYVDQCLERGLRSTSLRRVSASFFNAHNDISRS